MVKNYSVYETPDMRVYSIRTERVLCDSGNLIDIYYGDGGKPGSDDEVDGGYGDKH